MCLTFLFLLTAVCSETLTFTKSTPPLTNTIECQEATSECIINCNDTLICTSKEIHCHPTSQLPCTINLNAASCANVSVIYAHSSPIVHINGNGAYCGENITIHAYEQGGIQLFLESTYDFAFYSARIYGPIGRESILYMKGGSHVFNNVNAYDDWSTTVRLESTSSTTFKDSYFSNIFDTIDTIARDDANYDNVDMNYRASVYILDCSGNSDSFTRFLYNGVNHGDWFIRAHGFGNFQWSSIYATTDDRIDQSIPYNVKFYTPGEKSFRQLDLYLGVGAEVYIDVDGADGFAFSRIYAKDANSLHIYCHGSAWCGHKNEIECPSNGLPNSCNWICEDPADCQSTESANISIDTPSDDFNCNNLYLSSRIFAKIYCGYDQTTDYCNYTSISDINTAYTCASASACSDVCTFDNIITPISIGSELELICNDDPIVFSPTNTPTANPTIDINPTIDVNPTSDVIPSTSASKEQTAEVDESTMHPLTTRDTAIYVAPNDMSILIVILLVLGAIVLLSLIIFCSYGCVKGLFHRGAIKNTRKVEKPLSYIQNEPPSNNNASVDYGLSEIQDGAAYWNHTIGNERPEGTHAKIVHNFDAQNDDIVIGEDESTTNGNNKMRRIQR